MTIEKRTLVQRTLRRGFGRRLGWLLGAALLLPSPLFAQTAEPDPFTRAAMEKRREAEAMLASAMARIGNDRTDVTALIDAARASLTLENPQAALGFTKRAGQLRANDGDISALTGSAMLQLERPAEAMEYFTEASKLGGQERLFLSDRGMANDLLGRQDAAQRDYEAALSQTNDPETVRRYALSLGISGQLDRAVTVLTPQLRGQDRAAWRARAMILAIAGRQAEAQEIVKATMPGPLVSNINPFLARLPSLTPAQQAAAVHFGALPGGVLPGTVPSAPVPRPKPVVVAAAPTPAPTPPPVARPTVTLTPAPVAAAARPVAPPPRVVPAPSPAPVPAPVPAPLQVAKPPTAPNDLAAVMASLAIPANELKPTEGALDAAALDRIKEEQRQAANAAAEERKREVAAARAKAEAEAKAKAEADQKKAHPARQWVQVATGANASALAGDFGRLAKKYPAEFKGQKGATAVWGRTRRLVVGPFPNARAANSWLAALKKAGGDGFAWSSDAGEEVAPVR
jgi:Flp pilus assembly protein TadD